MSRFIKLTVLATLSGVALSACSGPDVGSRVAGSVKGTPASEQRVTGKTILMTPRLEDVTEASFNIRYMEMSFGTGTPSNVRDLAIEQCAKGDRLAIHKGNSRGLIQLNTVKAYYECVDGELSTDK